MTEITNYSQAIKTDHWAVLAFTNQCTELGTQPDPFTLALCEYRAPVLYTAMVSDFVSLSILSSSSVILFSNDEEVISYLDIPIKQSSQNHNTFFTFDVFLSALYVVAASNWPPGHPRSDHYVSNPHRPDNYCIQAGREDPQCS